MPAPAITLLTDFGTADGYVAELKSVLTSCAPGVPLLDMTHDVPAQDVEHARLTVARYWRRFPVGTVHLVVVDPGVGTSRADMLNAAIAVPAVAGEARSLAAKVRPVSGAPLAFETPVVGSTSPVRLAPWYRMAHERYVLYWRVQAG